MKSSTSLIPFIGSLRLQSSGQGAGLLPTHGLSNAYFSRIQAPASQNNSDYVVMPLAIIGVLNSQAEVH
jgi:hypothetical protein